MTSLLTTDLFFFLLLWLAISVVTTDAFVQQHKTFRRSPTPLQASPVDTVISSIFTSQPSFLLVAEASVDPNFGAEVLTDMAHVALDFTSILSPSKSIIRWLSVFGRLFAISADYLPDQSIHTEELCIQVFLLGLVMKDIVLDKFNAGEDEAIVSHQDEKPSKPSI